MVWTPASTWTCRRSCTCEKALGSTRSWSLAGTRMALALCLSCPLRSVCTKHPRTTRLNRLHSWRVSQIGSARIFCVLPLTNSSSQPKVLRLPMRGDCRSLFLHGWRRHVCRGCTGHLMLVKRVTIQVAVEETPSTDTEEPKPKPPNNTTTKQQTKNQPPGNNCTWCATQAAKSTKMREGETGAMNSAFALSTS